MTREVYFLVEARRGQRAQRKVDWQSPVRANQLFLAQVGSTAVIMHNIAMSQRTPGIRASDRNYFFPCAQAHEMTKFSRSASDRLLTILQSWLECSFQNVTAVCASRVLQRVVRRDEVT